MAQGNVIHHGSFRIERRYPASAARVFAAHADPAKRRRWFVEGVGFDIFEFTPAFRVGGTEVSRFAYGAGPEIRNDTTYLDIIENERIVFSYTMSMHGRPFSASLSTIEITPEGNGSRLAYVEQGAYFDRAEAIADREHGCRELLERLADELAAYP